MSDAPPPRPSPDGAVLVVGGAGAFGSRLARGIVATTPALRVVVAGRDLARAEAVARALDALAPGRASALRLDARAATAAGLRATGSFAVVDAAGPFQGGGFALAEAAVAAGLHYLDLSDARDWVAAFPARLEEAARAAGLVALTGASSTPALSHAALDAITEGWSRVDAVEVAIAPGNRAPRGLSVVRAILSYAGRPVRVFDGGAWRDRPGWGMLARRDLGGGLGRRWLSLCDTPDLDLIPARYGVRRSAVFRAGLELPALHLGLWLASLPVRAGLLPSLSPFARPSQVAAALLYPFGTDRGGMRVEAWGLDVAGRVARAAWTLVAEAGDGPVVPTLPALAALRALTERGPDALGGPGARACVGVLGLGGIEAEFAPYRIATSREAA